MNVRKCAKNLVNKYDLYTLDYKTLETVLADLGFSIVRFDKNNPTIIVLFDTLKLDEATKAKKCFTYVCDQYRQVFLSEYLSAEEYIFMLLHEIGHIKMKHIIINNTYASELDEKEAHEFAFTVLKYADRKVNRSKLNQILLNGLVVLAVIIMISLFALTLKATLNNNDSTNGEQADIFISKASDEPESHALESSMADESHIEVSEAEPLHTDQITESLESPIDTSEDEIFYITSSGKKYHTEFCSVIQNKTNVYYGYKDSLEEMGYEPCQLCIGDR